MTAETFLEDNAAFQGVTPWKDTRAEIAAMDPTKTRAAILVEVGRKSTWSWDGAITVAVHQADTGQVNYVAPNPAADGAYVRHGAEVDDNLGVVEGAEVLSVGWQMELLFAQFKDGGTMAPDPRGVQRATGSVISPGFDKNGVASQISRNWCATKQIRQPFPTQDIQDEVENANGLLAKTALSTTIYISDIVTILGVKSSLYHDNAVDGSGVQSKSGAVALVNSSVLTYPNPNVKVLSGWRKRIDATGATAIFQPEIWVDHGFAREGQAVPYVKIILSDGTNEVEGSANTEVQSTQTANPAPVFRPSADAKALNHGPGTMRVEVYPWIGTVWKSDASGYDWPTPLTTKNIPIFIDQTGNYSPCYVRWDTTATGSGTASDVQATAEAGGFTTIDAALDAAETFNNARGHNDCDAVEVLIDEYHAGFGADISGRSIPFTWCTFKPTSGTAAKSVGIRDTSSTVQRRIAPGMAFEDLDLESQTAGRAVLDGLLDNTGVVGPPQCWALFRRCRIAGTIGSFLSPLFKMGLKFGIDCEYVEGGGNIFAANGNRKEHWAVNLGGTVSNTSTVRANPFCMIGVIADGCDMRLSQVSSANVWTQPNHGYTVAYCIANDVQGSSDLVTQFNALDCCFTYNVWAKSNGVTAVVTLSADNHPHTVQNFIYRGNSTPGERSNIGYNASDGLEKWGWFQFNLHDQWNIKGDVFATQPYTGNWRIRYGVDMIGEGSIELPDTTGVPTYPDTENPISWRGDFNGKGAVVPATVTFTDDRSFRGTGAGGGVYKPTGDTSSIANAIPAGLAPKPFDVDGTVIPNDGTALRGAYASA